MPTPDAIEVAYAEQAPSLRFPWGRIRMLCDPDSTGSRGLSLGVVESLPGCSHELHSHASAEEIIYVLSGHGELHQESQPPRALGSGAMIFIPPGCAHAVRNVGTDLLHLIIVYAPPGPELLLRASASLHESMEAATRDALDGHSCSGTRPGDQQ